MDEILDGVWQMVHFAGNWLAEDDKADIANPKAHPGVHHYQIGVGLIWLSQLAYLWDAAASNGVFALAAPKVPPEDDIESLLVELGV